MLVGFSEMEHTDQSSSQLSAAQPHSPYIDDAGIAKLCMNALPRRKTSICSINDQDVTFAYLWHDDVLL